MTKEEFLAKTEEMVSDWQKWVMEEAEKIADSEAINLESFEDNYALPKNFLSAMGKKIEFEYRPLNKKDIQTRDKIFHHLFD